MKNLILLIVLVATMNLYGQSGYGIFFNDKGSTLFENGIDISSNNIKDHMYKFYSQNGEYYVIDYEKYEGNYRNIVLYRRLGTISNRSWVIASNTINIDEYTYNHWNCIVKRQTIRSDNELNPIRKLSNGYVIILITNSYLNQNSLNTIEHNGIYYSYIVVLKPTFNNKYKAYTFLPKTINHRTLFAFNKDFIVNETNDKIIISINSDELYWIEIYNNTLNCSSNLNQQKND